MGRLFVFLLRSAQPRFGNFRQCLKDGYIVHCPTRELAAGCTSNGNDLVGLASIKPNEDKTLRSGDMIARETILEVVKCVDEGNVRPSLERRRVSAGFSGEELSFHLRIFWAANLGCWEDHMEQAIRQATQADLVEPSVPGISWAAVLAGAVASLALTLVLISFGAGMGFSVVSPWGNSGVSASTFKIGTGLYFIVMAMISSAIGGYLAGRLRTKWVGVQTEGRPCSSKPAAILSR